MAISENKPGGLGPLMTVDEVAAHCKMARKTIANHWRKYGLTAIRVGGCLRFRESDVAEWLASNEERGTL